ncbi:MAG: hypothetical protein L6V91_09580 [Bacilli bacterium]|nr:MAG: hypothetical protein L6V91_09580 [Bacilli bacterium]
MVILLVVLFVEITDVLLVAFFTSSTTVVPVLFSPDESPGLFSVLSVPILVMLSELLPLFSSGINSSLV